MLDTAKKKNLIVQLAYMYRYNPAIQKTFELINEGVADIHCMSDEYLVDELILESKITL